MSSHIPQTRFDSPPLHRAPLPHRFTDWAAI